MPNYNETLDVARTRSRPSGRPTPGLDIDAEIEALRAEMQAIWDK